MKHPRRVHVSLMDEIEVRGPFTLVHPEVTQALQRSVRRALRVARQKLLECQEDNGSFRGQRDATSLHEADLLLLLAFLNRLDDPLARKAARQLRFRQLPGGGWPRFRGGRYDVDTSVRAYFAMKLSGCATHEEFMHRARRVILAQGGADRCNAETRRLLALLGQIPHSVAYDGNYSGDARRDNAPSGGPRNRGKVSDEPLGAIAATAHEVLARFRPVQPVPREQGIRELFILAPQQWPPVREALASRPEVQGGGPFQAVARRVRNGLRRAWRGSQRRAAAPRTGAVEYDWPGELARRIESLDLTTADFPSLMWAIIALSSRPADAHSGAAHPEALQRAWQGFQPLLIEDSHRVRVQPTLSAVCDTALALETVLSSGIDSSHATVVRASTWLLKQTSMVDSRQMRASTAARVATALQRQFLAENFAQGFLPPVLDLVDGRNALGQPAREAAIAALSASAEAISACKRFLLSKQLADGGWSGELVVRPELVAGSESSKRADSSTQSESRLQSESSTPPKSRLATEGDVHQLRDGSPTKRRRRDTHNAGSCPHVTALVLEALGHIGLRFGHPVVQKATAYLKQSVNADGGYGDATGRNRLETTCRVLCAWHAVGQDTEDCAFQAAVDWLLAHQHPSGGWGERNRPGKMRPLVDAEPTATQTAWAVRALCDSLQAEHPALIRGVECLVERQRPDGSWFEHLASISGWAPESVRSSDMVPRCEPLLALARWSVACAMMPEDARESSFPDDPEVEETIRFGSFSDAPDSPRLVVRPY
jgi:squalene-hopene/tetraprenyl-beta-curcumene cyclase